ncbi:MAG: SGNH/GDSL hydrolase family protein [Cryobacterium sp.]|nr:SGNH/GDSL hydrolase family protein [Cryobacterium sp.]
MSPDWGATVTRAPQADHTQEIFPRVGIVEDSGILIQQHPWSRFVAIGDSFTEGIGDPEPRSSGGTRGWADRVAEVLSAKTHDFAYANLAIRGRLLQQIIDEQVEPALELRPDLITVSAGGNDIIRPGTDPDDIAERLEHAIERLRSDGATVLLFNGPDIGMTPVLRRSRGKVAIYNENLRAIAVRHDAIIADMWALRELKDPRMWAPDRLHFSPTGHHTIARMVLDSLGVENDLAPFEPEPLPAMSWRQARVEDIGWAREYLVPWVVRRIRHQSSGDGISPKRPSATHVDRHF